MTHEEMRKIWTARTEAARADDTMKALAMTMKKVNYFLYGMATGSAILLAIQLLKAMR